MAKNSMVQRIGWWSTIRSGCRSIVDGSRRRLEQQGCVDGLRDAAFGARGKQFSLIFGAGIAARRDDARDGRFGDSPDCSACADFLDERIIRSNNTMSGKEMGLVAGVDAVTGETAIRLLRRASDRPCF
jgi:hypothetical protein